MKKNLVLTGMMGVGKSTIGKNLALNLSYNFIDIDQVIEKKEGSSIQNIFKNKGESYFRKIENETTLSQLKKNKVVIALGGGAFLNKSIRLAIKNTSISFWLDINIDLLVKRLENSKKRPLLFGKDLSKTVKKIYLDRKNIYNMANFKIKCNSFKPEEITNKILEIYENSAD